ncbi:MAG TPA: hypothetical protein VNO54_19960 [Streptosporangiaceae bacterium]|nr:hypothetical protein [Streptosporangiaceae bacterium]
MCIIHDDLRHRRSAARPSHPAAHPREASGTYVVMEEKGMGHAARHLARTNPGHLRRGHDLRNISFKFACEGQPRVTT